jgi:peptidoglycan/xylan/chitin deacetylase (PgdA/CDA1 family)
LGVLALVLLLVALPPHLRNDVDGALRRFKNVVARQAQAFPQSFFLEGPGEDKAIALTFDDGPDPVYTDRILGILEKADVKATFFLVGAKVRHWPQVARRIERAGHATGGHGYEHIDLAKLSPDAAVHEQLEPTQKAFSEILGHPMRLFRPPYGALTDDEIARFAKRGLTIVDWSVDSLDWKVGAEGADRIYRTVMRYVHPGAIVLLHSGGGNHGATARALPGLLDTLRAQGYRFVTVPELLRLDKPATEAE